jgi:hypothetical protein
MLWAPKIARVSTLGISRLPFQSPETKCHLDVGLVERHKVYYKGEGGGLPQVRAMMSFMNSNLLVARPSTKSAPTCINQLVVWFVQVRVSKWIACPSSWSHPEAPTRFSTPKVLRAKERASNSLFFHCFNFRLTFESIKELGSASIGVPLFRTCVWQTTITQFQLCNLFMSFNNKWVIIKYLVTFVFLDDSWLSISNCL